VNVVARVIALAKLSWMVRITHGSIEVENGDVGDADF